jgi:hypothetical protein
MSSKGSHVEGSSSTLFLIDIVLAILQEGAEGVDVISLGGFDDLFRLLAM